MVLLSRGDGFLGDVGMSVKGAPFRGYEFSFRANFSLYKKEANCPNTKLWIGIFLVIIIWVAGQENLSRTTANPASKLPMPPLQCR